jgi:hypothetical protein
MTDKKRNLELELIYSETCSFIGDGGKRIVGKAEIKIYNSDFGKIKITNFSDNEGRSKEYFEHPCDGNAKTINSSFSTEFYKQKVLPIDILSEKAMDKLYEIIN